MFSVLLLETDLTFAHQVHALLIEKKYFVTVGHTLQFGYTQLERRSFDLVIVSDRFCDGQGTEFIDYLQRYSFPTRSILLSKKTSYRDRISAYRAGVDDFILKPVAIMELWWRLQLVCHRQKILTRQAVTLCDSVSIYPKEGLLQLRDQAVPIPKKEGQILACLIHHRSRVVGRDELMRWVWQEGELMPKNITLDVYIKRIRIRLGKYSNYLQTVRGFGYRITE